MFCIDLSEQIKTSLFGMLNIPYSPSGNTKQLVCPYIVSGLRVAAVK